MRRAILLLALMGVMVIVASGVAWAVNKIGTNGPDTLRGTNRADNLIGKGGNDALFALGGRDNLLGGEGKDWLYGGNERRPFGGEKNLVGGPGNDGVVGGIGADTVTGGSGDDFLLGDNGSDPLVMGGEGRDLILGGRGADRMVGAEGGDQFVSGPIEETSQNALSGGGGNDIFLVDNVPASKDVVSCGDGFDRLVADRKDAVAPDCEKVVVVHGSIDEVFEQEGEFFESLPPALSGFWDTFFDRFAPDPAAGS